MKDDAGRPVRFGSVGGGGRYDGLVARFREDPVPATGFSIGVSRLLAALRAINSPIVAEAAKPGPVVVLAMDRERMADYQRLVATLRAAGIASELYLGDGKMNAQLKYADRRGSLCAVIQGSNEREAAGGPQVVDPRSRARRGTRQGEQGPRRLSGDARQGAGRGPRGGAWSSASGK